MVATQIAAPRVRIKPSWNEVRTSLVRGAEGLAPRLRGAGLAPGARKCTRGTDKRRNSHYRSDGEQFHRISPLCRSFVGVNCRVRSKRRPFDSFRAKVGNSEAVGAAIVKAVAFPSSGLRSAKCQTRLPVYAEMG